MPAAAAIKVMIADDQQTSRLLIRSALTDLGITQVGMAKDGQEALDLVLRQPVHLIISDYHMPRMNGVELLRAVGMNPPTRQFLKMALELKVNNYLKKPVSTPELKKKIEAVFGHLQ